MQIELIDPAVKGTINILKTCTKVSSVKRVVLTSSMAAVFTRVPPLGPDDLVDESCFSDPSFCIEKKVLESCCDIALINIMKTHILFLFIFLLRLLQQWYALSKTLAEEAAWRFAKDNGIDLVVINPGLVVGPLLQPTLNFSVHVIVGLINGNFTHSNYRLVDVRDVALAHVKAFETPSANGRYIIEGPIVTINDIEKIFREFFPDLSLVNNNK